MQELVTNTPFNEQWKALKHIFYTFDSTCFEIYILVNKKVTQDTVHNQCRMLQIANRKYMAVDKRTMVT